MNQIQMRTFEIECPAVKPRGTERGTVEATVPEELPVPGDLLLRRSLLEGPGRLPLHTAWARPGVLQCSMVAERAGNAFTESVRAVFDTAVARVASGAERSLKLAIGLDAIYGREVSGARLLRVAVGYPGERPLVIAGPLEVPTHTSVRNLEPSDMVASVLGMVPASGVKPRPYPAINQVEVRAWLDDVPGAKLDKAIKAAVDRCRKLRLDGPKLNAESLPSAIKELSSLQMFLAGAGVDVSAPTNAR